MIDLEQEVPPPNPAEKIYDKPFIAKYLLTTDEDKKEILAEYIFILQDYPDDQFIQSMGASDRTAFAHSQIVKVIKDAFVNKEISSEASWYKSIEDKVLRFSVYASDTAKNIKKGKSEFEKAKVHAPKPGRSEN
jgi:hypothetical protein